MLTALAILSIFFQSITLLFVFLKNYRSATNYLFSALSLVVMAWAFLGFYFFPASIEIMRIIMFTVVLQNTLFRLFAKTFPKNELGIAKKPLIIYLVLSLVVGILALSPFLFTGVEQTDTGNAPIPGPALPVFLIHALFSIISGFRALGKKRRISRSATQKQQFKYTTLGAAVLWGVVPITNFIFTVITQNVVFVLLGPTFTFIFTSIIAFAIIKQKLFDIRAVVARSVAYTLIIGTVAGIYGGIIIGISSRFFSSSEITIWQQVFYIVSSIFIAFTFQPLKLFFDRLTNKIFFRDAYDINTVIKDLGKVLATQVNLEVIMHASLTLLSNNLKISHSRFVVLNEKDQIYKVNSFGPVEGHTLSAKDLLQFHHKTLYIKEELANHDRKKILSKHDIEAVLKLETADEIVGYILLGPKSSGNIYSSQDIKLLEISSNELAISIQNARYFAEIAEFNATLQEKIKLATAKLEKTNEKLKELDSAKDEFISMASHQLRTPLTTIKGYLSMVLEGDVGKLNKEQHQYVDQAFGSAQRMVYLIADLLNVSRLNTGKFVIEPVETDLSQVVQQEIDQLQRHAATRNIELIYKKPAKFPIVSMDETKTRQVIMNFTDNALYYTPEGGKVKVAIKETSTAIEFTVTDTGIGVPKVLQHKLFSKFYRADNAKQARPDGTGLGLFMAKKVIVAQGGAVIFKSKEGVGSTFGFSFPKKKILVNPKK